MDNRAVDEAYDILIQTGNSIANGDIPPEDVLSGNVYIPNVDELIPDESNNTEGQMTISSYNPYTGSSTVSDLNSSDIDDIIKHNMDNFISGEEDNKVLASKILENSELSSIQDSTSIVNLIYNRLNKVNMNYYSQLPDFMKRTVDDIYVQTVGKNSIGQKDVSKNGIAKMLLDEIIKDYNNSKDSMDLSLIVEDFNKDIEQSNDQMSKEFGDMFISIGEERKNILKEKIAKYEEEGNTDIANKLRDILASIDSAYDIVEFKEFCKTCNIKNFDLKKPKRLFDRFNSKYVNHKNSINDITACPIILDRHTNFTHEQNLMVCLAFCKYCNDMNPDNVKEHTFMYYFIRNIITIDRINPRGSNYESMSDRNKEFYDYFLANINNCITSLINYKSNIIEKNKK